MPSYRANDGNLLQHSVLCELIQLVNGRWNDLRFIDAHMMSMIIGIRDMARTFREMISWQLAFELNQKVQRLLRSGPAARDFKFRDQLADSTRSAPWNIAEGFGRRPEPPS